MSQKQYYMDCISHFHSCVPKDGTMRQWFERAKEKYIKSKESEIKSIKRINYADFDGFRQKCMEAHA